MRNIQESKTVYEYAFGRVGRKKIQMENSMDYIYMSENEKILIEAELNIPVRQHRKSGRRETVCPGLRKPLMRVYSRNVLSKP